MSSNSGDGDDWRPGDPLDLDDVTAMSPTSKEWRTEIDSEAQAQAQAQVPRRPIAMGTAPSVPGPPVPPRPSASTPSLPELGVARTVIAAQAQVPRRDPTPVPGASSAVRTNTMFAAGSPVPPRTTPPNRAPTPVPVEPQPPNHAPTPVPVEPRTIFTGPPQTVSEPRTIFTGSPQMVSEPVAPPAPVPATANMRRTIVATPPAGVPVVRRPASEPGAAQGASARPAPTPERAAPDLNSSIIDVTPGAKLGQFELIRELGRGGMGQVFLARDTRLARLVALKFLGHASRALTERFLVEARATARCQHENIVVIYEADEWQGKPYMALEFLEGEPLSKMLEGGTLAPSRVLELIVPVVRALHRAHEHGIVHCDLKPDNIFVTKEGVVKVLDFGIARALGQASVDVASGVVDSGISGTMPYMSPEQWGADEIDHRTDLWSVGIILWEMLTGRHPLDPISQQRLIHAASHLDQPMPRIGEAMPQLPTAFEEVIDRCLSKLKEQRYDSARALLDVLEPQLPGRFGRRLDEDENPFPGMTAFQEGDADRFFGRSRDVTHMVARMQEHPLLGVVAPSGVGKSSFLRAGVIPALKASGETWETFVTRPGRSPLSSLASLLQPMAQTATGDLRDALHDHDALLARLRSEPGYLGALLRNRARHKRERILIFVDQFEELYTMCDDLAERRAYTAVLAGIADDAASPLRVVVSMRSDFLDRAAEDRVFMDRLTRGLLFLPPVDSDGMREALRAPLQMVGYQFERESMIDEMVGALANAPGALPLLQFTAAMLWDSRDRTRRVLTSKSYEEIGGVGGALATHADHVLATMNADRQKLARAVFLRLVTVEGTRAIVDVDELTSLGSDVAEVQALLDQLVAARLLVVQSREDGAVVEIVHESMLTRWPTLRRWLDESTEDAAFLEQLRTAAKQWDGRGRAQGLLWRGEAMEDARTFARRFKGELPARERAYLDAVLALATSAGRRKRRLVIAAFGVLGVLFAAAIVAMLYIRNAEQAAQEQKHVAETQRKRAEDEATRAEEQKKRAEEETTRAKAAEAQVSAQLAEIKAAQAAADQAKQEKEVVSQNLDAANVTVQAKEKDLAKANVELKKLLELAKEQTKRAEDASKQLEVALAKERARVKLLEEKKSSLAQPGSLK